MTNETINKRILSGARYESYYKSTGLPLKYMYDDIRLVPETVDKPTFDALREIHRLAVPYFNEGRNVFIFSNHSGNGKTSWAVKLMKQYMQEYGCYHDIDCLFINLPEFLMMRKNAIGNIAKKAEVNELEQRLREARIVIFDDFACNKSSAYDEDYLYTIIDYRTRNNLSCIYTSNVYPVDLKKMMDNRIVDRVCYAGQRTPRMWLRGSSRRGTNPQVSKPTTYNQTPATTKNEPSTPLTTNRTISNGEVF